MKGHRLIVQVLGAIKRGPQTIAELAEETGINYVSTMRLVNELRASGIICRSGQESSPLRKGPARWQYAFKGGEAIVNGRPLTQSFLRLWNELQVPTAADEVATEARVSVNHARKTIHAMRRAKLAYRAEWVKPHVSLPTVLWVLGNKKDATRPPPLSEQEYNRRANRKRSQIRLVQMVSTDPWAVLYHQLRKAA